MAEPTPRRRDAGRPRGQHVTDAVLDATLAELATAGLEGLSVERVAQRAQVHKTTVYRRWPTREALIAAALEGLAVDAAARAPDTGSLRGDLLGLLGPVATFLGRPEGRAVARAALAAPAEAHVAALAARRLETPAAGAVEALVARAQARESGAPTSPPTWCSPRWSARCCTGRCSSMPTPAARGSRGWSTSCCTASHRAKAGDDASRRPRCAVASMPVRVRTVRT
jgi:AcrR family transcriptional regulator